MWYLAALVFALFLIWICGRLAMLFQKPDMQRMRSIASQIMEHHKKIYYTRGSDLNNYRQYADRMGKFVGELATLNNATAREMRTALWISTEMIGGREVSDEDILVKFYDSI